MYVPFIKTVDVRISDANLGDQIRSIVTDIVDALILDPFQNQFKFRPVILLYANDRGKVRELRIELDMHTRSVTVANVRCSGWYLRHFPNRVIDGLLPLVKLALGQYSLERPWEDGNWVIEMDFTNPLSQPRAIFRLAPDLAA